MVRIPLRRLLALTGAAGRTVAAAPDAPDVSAAFLRSIRRVLPFIGLWRPVGGGIEEIAWNGFEISFSGAVTMPKREPCPAAGLLFLSRNSRLHPSYRHLATIGFEPRALDNNSFAFSGSTALTAQHMRNGRNQMVLFVMAGDGRLYRAPQTSVPRVSSRFRLHDAA